MKKRVIAVAAALSLALLTAGCGTKEAEKTERPSLYDKGLACAATLSEELTQEYVGYFSPSPELIEIVEELAKQDYSELESVYELKYPDGGLEQLLTFIIGASFADAPNTVLQRAAGFSYMANMINARLGVNYLALSSILSAQELFVNEAVTEDTAYLYFYRDAYPVMVSFRVGEDGAIYATGTYLFDDEMKELGADCLTEGESDWMMFFRLFEISEVK